MKKTLHLFSCALLLWSCSENKTPTEYHETKNNLEVSFKTITKPRTNNETHVEITAKFTNVGNDTLYFYKAGCSNWVQTDLIHLQVYATGIKCIDTLPEIIRLAPKQIVQQEFRYYTENETYSFNATFGITCYPVDKDFHLTTENETGYLKHRKSLKFKPIKILIQS